MMVRGLGAWGLGEGLGILVVEGGIVERLWDASQ